MFSLGLGAVEGNRRSHHSVRHQHRKPVLIVQRHVVIYHEVVGVTRGGCALAVSVYHRDEIAGRTFSQVAVQEGKRVSLPSKLFRPVSLALSLHGSQGTVGRSGGIDFFALWMYCRWAGFCVDTKEKHGS